MELSIVSFTENGRKLAEYIMQNCAGDDVINSIEHMSLSGQSRRKTEHWEISCQEISQREISVTEWAGIQMREKKALLFIGACGIAVRAIAPHLTDKLHDSPVLVMDETGKYVIPLVSGHVGGANELACYIGRRTGAEPVVTTATDINGKFAVDLFAEENALGMMNKDGIARVSAKILSGEKVSIAIESRNEEKGEGKNRYCGKTLFWQGQPLSEGALPDGLYMVPYPPKQYVDILVTSGKEDFEAAICLRPKEYIIGLGCKRGKTAEEIEMFLSHRLQESDISVTQILALASISQKKDEQGILGWCRKEKIPFLTYTAEELQEVKGNFTGSSFVADMVGVDNVCERAALRACGENGELICGKYAKDGMTFALARKI
ncbi:MAG: cobalamin biosynthesis protein [Ruminococcus sp.]|nr:cobalamin biosynthesis protein [Ruminococcus sp.]